MRHLYQPESSAPNPLKRPHESSQQDQSAGKRQRRTASSANQEPAAVVPVFNCQNPNDRSIYTNGFLEALKVLHNSREAQPKQRTKKSTPTPLAAGIKVKFPPKPQQASGKLPPKLKKLPPKPAAQPSSPKPQNSMSISKNNIINSYNVVVINNQMPASLHPVAADQPQSQPLPQLFAQPQAQFQFQQCPQPTNHCHEAPPPPPPAQGPSPAIDPAIFQPQPEPEPTAAPAARARRSSLELNDQDLAKLERKRQRNRVAANKCRTMKLQRIADLELQVADLQADNAELEQLVAQRRLGNDGLRQQLVEHWICGCPVELGAWSTSAE